MKTKINEIITLMAIIGTGISFVVGMMQMNVVWMVASIWMLMVGIWKSEVSK